MTCIAGVVEGDRVFIGGDSAVFADTRLVLRRTPKVFRVGPFLIGCAGSLRVRDAMQYHLVPPKHPRAMSVACYMRTEFVDAVRAALKKAGTLRKDHEVESSYDSMLIVGYRKQLFVIEDDLQVGESFDEFCAVGCGADVAHGALTVTDGMPAKKRILAALAAAERYNVGVRRPFTVLVLEGS